MRSWERTTSVGGGCKCWAGRNQARRGGLAAAALRFRRGGAVARDRAIWGLRRHQRGLRCSHATTDRAGELSIYTGYAAAILASAGAHELGQLARELAGDQRERGSGAVLTAGLEKDSMEPELVEGERIDGEHPRRCRRRKGHVHARCSSMVPSSKRTRSRQRR